MKNDIKRKSVSLLNNFKFNKLKYSPKKHRLSLQEPTIQENSKLDKNNKISLNKMENHRQFFLNILKQRILNKKKLKNQNSKEHIFELLSIDPSLRTGQENREIGIYLSFKYDYFKKIKEEDGLSKLDKVTSILHLKKFIKDDIIINYDEKQDKIFIILEGTLNIYKPIFVEKIMTPIQFLKILNIIQNKEHNISKYKRIKEKNKEIHLDISLFEKLSRNEDLMWRNYDFFIEDYKKIDNYNEGQIFGAKIDGDDDAIKNSDIVIKSNEESILLYFDINDYKKILRKFKEKKYKKEIDNFKNEYPFFKYFTDDKILDIFGLLSSKSLFKDEYLYKQNEKDDKIYFIIKGKFSMYSYISFNWLNEYLDYIRDSKTNLIFYLIKKNPKTQIEYNNIIDELQSNVIKSPMIKECISNIEKLDEKENEKYVIGVKNEEENINAVKKIFKLNIKNVNFGDMIGIEDCIEFKKRYCSVKCVSDMGEVKFISIYDLMKMIKVYNNENNYMNNHLLDFIAKTKFMLYQQILKDVRNLKNKLTFQFNTKYNNLIKINKNNLSIDEKNKSIAAIKAKGYKYDIKEVFDKNIPIFPNHKNPENETYYSNNHLLLKSLLMNPRKKNRHILKFRHEISNPTLLNIINNNTMNTENTDKNFLKAEKRKKNRNLTTVKFSTPLSSKNKIDISLSTNLSSYNNNIVNLAKSRNEKGKIKLKKLSVNRLIKNHKALNILNTYDCIKQIKEKNYSNTIKNKRLNNLLLDNSPLSKKSKEKFYSSYGERNKTNTLKLIKNDKKINKISIETILSEKVSKTNKKYYLGILFKNKLDEEKKKFNLIHYKEFFNKKG